MFILELDQQLIDACGDYGLASILRIVQKGMDIVQIVVPIIMIVSATFILIKMFMNPEEKKAPKALINCIAAGVIVFFIPFIVNLTMGWLDDSFDVTACWNVAEETEDMIEWQEQNSSEREEKPNIKNKEEDYNFSH